MGEIIINKTVSFVLFIGNQVSEQEMDEVIARSTSQDCREAGPSPGLGIVTALFPFNILKSFSWSVPLGPLPRHYCWLIVFKFGKSNFKEILCFLLTEAFKFCCYVMYFIQILTTPVSCSRCKIICKRKWISSILVCLCIWHALGENEAGPKYLMYRILSAPTLSVGYMNSKSQLNKENRGC